MSAQTIRGDEVNEVFYRFDLYARDGVIVGLNAEHPRGLLAFIRPVVAYGEECDGREPILGEQFKRVLDPSETIHIKEATA